MMKEINDKNLSDMGLADAVENKLRIYFRDLNGDKPVPYLYEHIIREVEKPLISVVLKYARGNKVKAAEFLGINRNTLYKKIQDFDLDQD